MVQAIINEISAMAWAIDAFVCALHRDEKLWFLSNNIETRAEMSKYFKLVGLGKGVFLKSLLYHFGKYLIW